MKKNAVAAAHLMAALVGLPTFASNLSVQSSNTNTGNHAARLTVSRTCTAGDAMVPDGDLSSDPSQEPCGTLTANDVDVVSGSVRFKAGAELQLGNGFSVAAAATFIAEIGGTVLGTSLLRDDSPDAERLYFVRFYTDPTNLALTQNSQQFEHFIAYDTQGNREFILGVTYNSSLNERRLFAAAYENSGVMRSTQGTCEQVLLAGWHSVEARWTASSGSDGDLEVSIDGGVFQSLSTCLSLPGGLVNSAGEISAVEWGVQNMPDGDLGEMDLDDFASQRSGPIGGI